MDQKEFEKLLKNETFVKGILSQKNAKEARSFFDTYKLKISDTEIKEFYAILSEILSKIDNAELDEEDIKDVGGGSNNEKLNTLAYLTVLKVKKILPTDGPKECL